MKVLMVACAGGFSSSLLANKIRDAATGRGFKTASETFEVITDSNWSSKVSCNLDLLVLYGGASSINEKNLKKLQVGLDGILVSPQVKFMSNRVVEATQKFSPATKVKDMDRLAFGRMDGEKMLEEGLAMLDIS